MGEGVDQVSPSVLIAHASVEPSHRYRCLHLCEQLHLCGIRSVVARCSSVRLREGVDHSVTVLHRIPLDRHSQALIKRILAGPGILVFDIDDLIFDGSLLQWVRALGRERKSRVALYSDEVRRYRKALESSDAVLASDKFLADQVAALGKPAWVHRNAFSLEMLRLSEQAQQARRLGECEVVIGYASGTPTHDRDFQQAKPALMHILDRYPQSVLWIIGPLDAGGGWGRLRDRIRHIPFVPWQELPALLAHFDINIAPLETDNPFCQAKSEVKYIEAGLVRVPTVASTTDAFEYAIRSGDNGFLATTHEDWIEALEQLVGDAGLRREMGERAYADVLERYHPAVRGRELIRTLDQISREVKGRALWPDGLPCLDDDAAAARLLGLEAASQRSVPGRHRSLLDRALYALRYRGVRIFLMQAWVYLQSQLGSVLSTCGLGRQRRHGSR